MAAPELVFRTAGGVVSGQDGYDHVTVAFSSDIPYARFECRATRQDAPWGLGKGTLIASFSQTPAETERSFEVYDGDLVAGDGAYRISLYAQGEDGSWNDNHSFLTTGGALNTSDGKEFLCMR